VKIFAILSALLADVGLPAMAAETVTWLAIDTPPVTITEGALAGQGIGDGQIRFLAGKLPMVESRTVTVSSLRMWNEIEHDETACTVPVARIAAHEKEALFSARYFEVPGMRLVIRQDRLDAFAKFLTERGEVDLDRILADKSLTGILVSGRAYDPVITRFIEARQKSALLDMTPIAARATAVLDAGRADFAILLDMEVHYLRRSSPLKAQLIELPIRDAEPRLRGYVACSNSSMGRKVIAEIDRLLEDPANWRDFLKPVQRWSDAGD
jgi:uncharacterized protein (TIGR02285 family)